MTPRIGLWGGSGRLGRLLRAEWGNDAVVCYGRKADNGTQRLAVGDVPNSIEHLDALIVAAGPTTGPDVVVHEKLAQFALSLPVERIVLLSSAAVYGCMEPSLSEPKAAPVSDYGRAKLAMEQLAAGSRALVLRLGNVAGADALLGQLGPNRPTLHVFPNGDSPRRSYIGPQTLAACLLRLAESDATGLLNLAQPGSVTMGALLKAAGRDWNEEPAPDHAIADVTLDTTRAETLIGDLLPRAQASQMVKEWQTLTARL